ncbi:serine peptidase [Gluconobacter albidus]|uniref:Serine peptidase n=1 Tax=Gluconobacter albidus TaxID=318683 RepID=A0A149TMC9_9PROT|nr:S49 family peptidase [Gluconobacter albidus]KXV50226.1 serine peptidase [Gluconobacter albidus]
MTQASSLFLNRPLMLSSARSALLKRSFEAGAGAEAFFGERDTDAQSYEVVQGVALIPVSGILLPGRGWSWSGATYYQDIRKALNSALDDPAVSRIALMVNSPGGTVSECFDTAEMIYQARDVKPIWAILNDAAYSAAYAIASAADFITVPQMGGTGSIGCVGMHIDITDALDKAGIKVTTFQYGARKTDGYPTTPMTDSARERAQAEIDEMGDFFVQTVARNRGIAADVVRNTQAGTYLGRHGVEIGLADEIATPEEAIAAFLKL